VFPEAECYRVYRYIRSGVSGHSESIGQGYNLIPPPASLSRVLQGSIAELLDTGRLGQYSCAADDAERELLARLVGRRLRRPELRGEHVSVTNGGHEAISIAILALRSHAHGLFFAAARLLCFRAVSFALQYAYSGSLR